MTRKLSSRLDTLESAAASTTRLVQDRMENAERQEKAMRRLAEKVEEARTGKPAWESLSPAKQVHYWGERMKEAEQTITSGLDDIRTTPGVAPGIDIAMRKLAISIAPAQLAEAQEQLAKLSTR